MSEVGALKTVALASLILALAPLAALAQPAKPDAKQPEQCFLSSDVNGFQAPDDHTVYVRVGVKSVYRLDLMSDCTGLTYRQSFGLNSKPDAPWVCSPLDATVIYRDNGVLQRCLVKAIHKLTADELSALPKRDLP